MGTKFTNLQGENVGRHDTANAAAKRTKPKSNCAHISGKEFGGVCINDLFRGDARLFKNSTYRKSARNKELASESKPPRRLQ